MIKIEDIRKSYGDVEVLKGVNLHIEAGKVTAIVGPSGAGKTTLLHIMGTLENADSGRVLFNGKNVSDLRDKELSRFRNANIGFVFQQHRLLPEFTLVENVAMPAMIGGVGRKEALQRASALLTMLGLGERLEHRPAQLSGGEAQRGAVARALINNAPVVMADEPSGSLDSHNREELHNLFFDLRDRLGTTFVIVTHDNDLAARCDSVVHIADGQTENGEWKMENKLKN